MNESNNVINNSQSENLKDDGEKLKDRSDIDLILDIPLNVSVELGNAKILVNDLLQLGQGSILELNKPVGDPVEIYVNNKLIARGEVVVVDEKFGVRITDSISPLERVKSLA